jgi:hypothetical protein
LNLHVVVASGLAISFLAQRSPTPAAKPPRPDRLRIQWELHAEPRREVGQEVLGIKIPARLADGVLWLTAPPPAGSRTHAARVGIAPLWRGLEVKGQW